MTFNELLIACEQAGQKVLANALYEYILINFNQADFEKAAQMMADQIVNWDPQPVRAEDWILSTDFSFAQNFAQLLRARGVLPPPVPVEALDEGYEIVLDGDLA